MLYMRTVERRHRHVFRPCKICAGEFAKLQERIRILEVEKEKNVLEARTDFLTKLPNLQHFYEVLKLEVARAGHSKTPLTVVYLDLDFFKKINDTHGHPVGDRILRKLGEILRSSLRMGDFCARMGGEEFAVVLPATSVDEAKHLIKRLHHAITARLHVTVRGEVVHSTASIGVARKGDDEGLDEFLARVDKALYAAKRSGRNRIHSDC
jgi:diguanylate cyclase (GGDEF)-like protein